MSYENMDLADAVQACKKSEEHVIFRAVLGKVESSVRSGDSLSQALKKQSLFFPKHDITLLDLALETGNLLETLKILSISVNRSMLGYSLKWVFCILFIFLVFTIEISNVP